MDPTRVSAGRARAMDGSWRDRVVDTVRSHVQSFAITGRVLWALMLYDFRAQYGHRRLGFFWAFVPTLYLVVFLVAIMSAIRHRTAPTGFELGPFVALGVMSLQFYSQPLSAVSKAVQQGKAVLTLPRVKVMDLYVAKTLLSMCTLTVVFTVVMGFFVLIGQTTLPEDLLRVFPALVIGSTIGFAFGLVDTVLSKLASGWDLVMRMIGRLTFMTSGLFFVADSFPPSIQGVLYYQPILHLTEWVRSGYLPGYESRFYDPYYPAMVALCLLLFGLGLERVFRQKVLEGKKKK